MAEAGTLRFLLAPADALAADPLSSEDLAIVQGQGVTSAFALRIVVSHDLGGRFQRVCDAITPRFEPERLWLGVYQASPANPSQWQRLDSFPLSEARNESCWFYPTHDGHYLSWQRQLQVRAWRRARWPNRRRSLLRPHPHPKGYTAAKPLPCSGACWPTTPASPAWASPTPAAASTGP